MIILVLALGAVSEIVRPLTFAAVLTGIFQPVDGIRGRPWFCSPSRPVWLSPAPPLPGGFFGKVAGRAEPTLQRIFD